MTTLTTQPKHRNRRSDNRLRMIKKMAAWRAAKERKRIERGGIEEEPRFVAVRHPDISWAMRDMARRASIVAKFYQPKKIVVAQW